LNDAPENIPAPPVIVDPKNDGFNAHETRPWARWVAKSIDVLIVFPVLMIFFVGLGISLGLFHPDPEPIFAMLEGTSSGGVLLSSAISIGVYVILLWLYDAMLVATFGSTPGKSLMGVKIARANGETIGYGQSFLRSAGMLSIGMVFLIPLLSLIGYIAGYTTLKSKGATLWDSWASATVITQPVAGWRWVIGILLVIVERILGIAANMLG
jgi:uncharacterized RDD family membrane protein YckC